MGQGEKKSTQEKKARGGRAEPGAGPRRRSPQDSAALTPGAVAHAHAMAEDRKGRAREAA